MKLVSTWGSMGRAFEKLPRFEAWLANIEGMSPPYVVWMFGRASGWG
jgi:hypothetical protein